MRHLTPEQAVLVAANVGLVVWCVSKFFPKLRGDDRDEAISDGNLGLCEAALYWRGGGSFTTYATVVIRQRVQKGLAERAEPLRPVASPMPPVDPAELVAEQDEAERVAAASLALPIRLRAVLPVLRGDEEPDACAERLRVSEATVRWRVQRASDALRKAVGE